MGLDTVELVMEAEKVFEISIPDEEAEKVYTVEQFAKLIFTLRQQSNTPIPYEDILLLLQLMIAENFAIPIARVTPQASFTKDLGLN